MKGKTLFALNFGFYISEHGEIALRNYESYLGEFYFYFESFETFIEQQSFFEEYRYFRELPGLGNKLNCSINHLPAYFSNYEFIIECSDKYHRIWKNKTNIIHARLYPEGWSIFFDILSENKCHELICKLKAEKIIE